MRTFLVASFLLLIAPASAQHRRQCQERDAVACLRLGDELSSQDVAAARKAWRRAERFWRAACKQRVEGACALAEAMILSGRVQAVTDPKGPAPVSRPEWKQQVRPTWPDLWCGTSIRNLPPY